MAVVHAAVALFHCHLVAVRRAVWIEPTGIGKVIRVDDERVSLPMPDRVSIPARVRIVAGKFSPVHPYVAPDSITPEELNDFLGRLGKPHLRRHRTPQDAWETRRITPPGRIVPVFFVGDRSVA